MTRRRWVYINGEAVEIGDDPSPQRVHEVMGDITPYKSMVDGSLISSRSQHRAHLKQHGCVEVGNEAMKQMSHYDNLPKTPAPQRRKEMLIRQIGGMTQKEFKQAVKRDVDNVKWNSRTD